MIVLHFKYLVVPLSLHSSRFRIAISESLHCRKVIIILTLILILIPIRILPTFYISEVGLFVNLRIWALTRPAVDYFPGPML